MILYKEAIQMCDLFSPYTPGAGSMPSYLAGREKNIQLAERRIEALQHGYPQSSIIYYGLRGVGKTVLLNTIEQSAENLNVLYKHIEVRERGSFLEDIVSAITSIVNQLSVKSNVAALAKRAIYLIRSLILTYNFENKTLSAGFNNDESYYSASGNLSMDLTDLFEIVGKIAKKSDTPICLFIDEIQYADDKSLEALITAIHRSNQLRLPIMIFGAGLPKILKTLGEIKTYTERLFMFEEIGSLKGEDAVYAITEPAKEFQITYQEDAIKEILSLTDGYPYFIQQLCNTVWDFLEGNIITKELVQKSFPKSLELLDKGFFRVRYDRCTSLEQEFISAMVDCDKLPCTISNVAKIMKRDVKSISPTRASLIGKGLIYATGYGEIDFTVPQFDLFIRRIRGY